MAYGNPMYSNVPEEYKFRSPTREIPTYAASNIEQSLSSYRNLLQQLGGASTQYDLTARPVTWMDIQAQQVSATGAAREALAFNEENMGRYTSMAQELTRADVASKTSMLDQFVPDWRQKRDTASAINESLLRGEIPKDVADQLKRTAAYTSVMGGGGAGTQRALTARDLGTTSLQLQQQGMKGAADWTTLMSNLMPEQTRAADVMATQGLTSQQALATALQNASNQLTAAQENVRGRTETALKTEQMRLEAERGKAATDINRGQLLVSGFGNIVKSQADLEAKKYEAATLASLIAQQNIAMVQPEYRSFQATGLSPSGVPWVGSFTRPFYDYSKVQTSAAQYGFGIR